MKLLVTGGAGYVGSVCAAGLVEQGHDVTIIEVFNSGINSSEEVLSSANIVNGYLLSVVSSGHRVGNSGLRNVSGVRE